MKPQTATLSRILSITILTCLLGVLVGLVWVIPSSSQSPCNCPCPTPSPTPTPTPPTGESPNNTRVPAVSQITDSHGDVWTISGGWIQKNGVTASGGQGSQILYCAQMVYVFGGDLQWWKWVNGWQANGTVDPCGGPSASPTPAPEPTPTDLTFKVATWNLAHGQGTDNQFDFQGQVGELVSSGADIVAAQEVTPGGLANWNAAFSAAGFVHLGYTGNGGTNDGQALWVRGAKVTPVGGLFTKQLSNGFISWDGVTNVDKSAQAQRVTVGGHSFVIVNLHACWSKCADSFAVIETTGESWQRVAQLKTARSWIASTFPGESVIWAGDFNLTDTFVNGVDGGLQVELLTADYFDLWLEAIAAGVALTPWNDRDSDGLPDMTPETARTADKRRIDRILLSRNQSLLSLVGMEQPDTRAQCATALVLDGGSFPACPEVVKRWDIAEDMGRRRSDHNPLVAVFKVN